MIRISNDGELDLAGLRLLGASTKREGGYIGFFGTGTKYAMATLLRSGIRFQVFSGTHEVFVTTRKVVLRGQEFDEIIIDGTPTNFTTDLGPKWQPWMALREFVCNAMDEPGCDVVVEEVLTTYPGVVGKTVIIIHGMLLEPKYFRFDVADGPPLLSKTDEKLRVYRKGILVFESDTESYYDFELPGLAVTEDRMATFHAVRDAAWRALNESSVQDKIMTLACMKAFERDLPYAWECARNDWADALAAKILVTDSQARFFAKDIAQELMVKVNERWYEVLAALPGVQTAEKYLRVASGSKPLATPETPDEVDILGIALGVLRRFKIHVPMHTVELVEAFQGQEDGCWDSGLGKIFVRRGLSLPRMIAVLFHEWVHMTTGLEDASRAFETFICAEAARVMLDACVQEQRSGS